MILTPLDLDNTIRNWKTDLFKGKTYSYHEVYSATSHKIIPLVTLEGDIKEGLKKRLSKKPDVPIHSMGYYRIKKGLCIGNGLVADRKKNLLFSKTLTFDKHIEKRVKSFGRFLQWGETSTAINSALTIKEVKKPIINIMMPGMYIYGHWLIDILPKLYLLQESLDLNDYQIILPNDIPSFYKNFLALLNIPVSNILLFDPKTEIVKGSEVILPTKCRVIDGSWLAPYVGKMFDEISANKKDETIAVKGFEKIFLSRRKLKKQFRRLINRAEISEIILENGFVEMFPEEHSLEEQINIFSHAKVLIGEFGSALHNSLFGSQELEVISLQSNHIPLLVQWGVCNIKNQKCHIIFGNATETRQSINSDFIIDEQILRQTLSKV